MPELQRLEGVDERLSNPPLALEVVSTGRGGGEGIERREGATYPGGVHTILKENWGA